MPNSDPRLDKSRASFHQELLAKTIEIRKKQAGYNEDDLNPEQIGYLHAKSILKADHIPLEKRSAALTEAIRVVSAMLGKNPTLAKQFTSTGFEVIVVPADTPFTALPEFRTSAQLVNQVTGLPIAISENLGGAVRTWAETRGMGGIQIGSKIYVAVTEENLMGTATSGAALSAGGACYAKQYSTTAHEFAHTIHLHAMTHVQKEVIKTEYIKKLKNVVVQGDGSVRVGSITLDANLSPVLGGGAMVTGVEAKQALTMEWVDGARLHNTPWPAEYDIYLRNSAGHAFTPQRSFKSRLAPRSNYAASSAREYWAQLASAYLGCNGGTDPYTGRTRNNSRAWIIANESPEIARLLDEIFSPHGTESGIGSGFGASFLEDSNTATVVSPPRATLGEVIAKRKSDKLALKGIQVGSVSKNRAFFEKFQGKK